MPIHRPPGLVVTTTVDGTLTRDGDVSHLVAIDAWRIVPASQTFPRGTDEWIEIGIESEFQRRAFLENEVDMTFHFDGTCVPGSFRYNHLTATFLETREMSRLIAFWFWAADALVLAPKEEMTNWRS